MSDDSEKIAGMAIYGMARDIDDHLDSEPADVAALRRWLREQEDEIRKLTGELHLVKLDRLDGAKRIDELLAEIERLREENALLTKGWQPATPTALLDEIERGHRECAAEGPMDCPAVNPRSVANALRRQAS